MEEATELAEQGLPIHDPEPVYELDEITYDALRLFQSCISQWKISDHGVRMGIDYTSIPVLEKVHGIDMDEERFFIFRMAEMTTVNADLKSRAEKNAKTT